MDRRGSPSRRAPRRHREALVERIQDLGKPPLLMGVLNRTPDSFSDGGEIFLQGHPGDLGPALERTEEMIVGGAEILDLGGESTRPGARTVGEEEELSRVLPLVRALAERGDCWISADTQRASVARACLDAGAHMINDVSAGRRDPELWPLVAQRRVPYVLMHMRGEPANMQRDPRYDDVVREVGDFLAWGVGKLRALGLPADRILVDPGIGFGKTPEHNLALLGALKRIRPAGQALLLGASHKSFIGALDESPVHRRLGGSLAAVQAGLEAGARVLRVHDVRVTRQFIRVLEAIRDPGARADF